jgi:hypothetical protein
MFWFFERDDARLHYEVRRKSDGDAFELVITPDNGRQRVEQFREAGEVEARSSQLQERLQAAGWRTPATRRSGMLGMRLFERARARQTG